MDSSRRHGQLPRAFLEVHPHSSTSAATTTTSGLVAVRSCEGVDVRRADHGHDGRNDRSHHCGQCGAKIAFARAPRVSRQHLRRCARCSRQWCGSTAAVGRNRKAFVDARCVAAPHGRKKRKNLKPYRDRKFIINRFAERLIIYHHHLGYSTCTIHL